MQQAETGRSPDGAGAPTGNVFQNTAPQTFILETIDLDRVYTLSQHVDMLLGNAQTLLRCASDVAAESSADEGFWHRPKGWEIARFNHMGRLIDLVSRELGQLSVLMEQAGDRPGVQI